MLQRIKSLFKIQLEDKKFPLGLMALMQIFHSPSNTIMYSSGFDEAILVLVHTSENFQLKPISSHLGQKFKPHAGKRNWHVIISSLRGAFLGH